MKKIMLSLATVLAFTFTACDPVEDFTENTASNHSEEQINATLTQNGGDNLVEVTVHSHATAQISNGKQSFKANYAKVVMRELGENFIYIKLFNANGSIIGFLSNAKCATACCRVGDFSIGTVGFDRAYAVKALEVGCSFGV